jgi:hypothetical protein
MNSYQYRERLKTRLIRGFKKAFYEKTGQKVTVLVWEGADTGRKTITSLTELEEVIEDFNPLRGTFTIKSKYRKRDLAYLRHIFCILAYEYGFSLKEIGEYLGGRDHTTIIHCKKAAKNLLDTGDALFTNTYHSILNHIDDEYRTDNVPVEAEAFPEPVLPTAVL